MDLGSILLNAQNPSPAIRNAAEAQLNSAVEQQYDQFVLALCVELATEGKPETNRQLAGIYLKNLIVAQDDAIQQIKTERWISCDPNIKDQIRMGFLQALLSTSQVASHTAAQVVAAYGAVDIPRHEWPNLLTTLFYNVNSPEIPLVPKVTSLEALGYMSDAMDPGKLDKGIVDQILNTLVDGMKNERPNEIRRAAVTALNNSLEFTVENFEIPGERDAIMRVVCEATQCSDLNVRIKAFECIASVASLYYDKLQHYMEALFTLTSGAIRSDDQAVGQQAIEFWSTICDNESEIVELRKEGSSDDLVYLKIAEQAAPLLVPILLETLTKQDDSDSDDSWNIAMAGATCLDALAQTIEDSIVDKVVPFVQQNIISNEWRCKEAAVMAFGSIMNGPSPQKMTAIVASALPVLITCLTDSNSMVKDTTAWTIGRVCEFQTMAISPELLPPLVAGLSNSLEDPSSKVAAQACFAVHNLAAACHQEADAPSNVLSNFMGNMLQKLLIVTNREDWETDNLRATAYEAANMLITNCALDMRPIVVHVISEALNRLEATFTAQCDQQERMNLQSLLCGLVGVCTQKLTAEEITEPVADRIMRLLLEVFNVKGAVAHEDAFMSVGFLVDKLGVNFARYLEYLQPALINGLKNVEEHQVCTVAVGVVGDLCRALNKKLLPSCDLIVRCLLDLLQSQSVHRDVKPHVLSVFADIAMAIEGDFERYANVVLGILQQAGEISITSEDEDLIDYINSLRESILEAYTGILQGLLPDNKHEVVIPFFEKILDFIQRCAVDPHHSSLVLKALVGLLGDMGNCFGTKMYGVLTQPFVQQVLQEAMSEEEDIRTIANWTQSVIMQIQSNVKSS